MDAGRREPRRLTDLNRRIRRPAAACPQPETFTFRSFDGTEVQGWLYPALDARGPSPVILSIHGGPHGAYGFGFNPTFQIYAARGYACSPSIRAAARATARSSPMAASTIGAAAITRT